MRHHTPALIQVMLAAVAAAAYPSLTNAQTLGDRAVAVRTRDAAGNPVSRADLTLRDSAAGTTQRGVTDSLGRMTFRAPTARALILRVQRVGFRQVERRIEVAAGADTARVDVVLQRIPMSFDTVRVTVGESLRRRVYHIDSTDIAASKRTLFDAWDVITKLRPDIAYGRGPCGGVADVWINGQWIPPELVSPNEIAIERLRATAPSAATPHLNAIRGPMRGRAMVVSLLSLIKPEDIAEMTYHDPCSPPLAAMHTDAALFIVLKPGLDFDPGRGVYRVAPR